MGFASHCYMQDTSSEKLRGGQGGAEG